MIKGSKHSFETLQKISVNTRLAMRNPVVRKKISKFWFKKGLENNTFIKHYFQIE